MTSCGPISFSGGITQDYTDTEICVRGATSLLRGYVFIYSGVVNSGFYVQVEYKPDSNVAAVMFTSQFRPDDRLPAKKTSLFRHHTTPTGRRGKLLRICVEENIYTRRVRKRQYKHVCARALMCV